MRPKKYNRILLKSLLFTAIGASLFIGFQAYKSQAWETIASVLAVITGVLAIFSSLNLTWNQEDQNDPMISLFIDKSTHQYAFNLVIENIGGSPAYNVLIDWKTPLLDFRNKMARFSEYPDSYDFEFLPSNRKFTRLLLSSDEYKKMVVNSSSPLVYEGVISYSFSPKSTFRAKQEFIVSFEPFRIGLTSESDQADFYFKNKEIGKHLNGMAHTLKRIELELKNSSDTENE